MGLTNASARPAQNTDQVMALEVPVVVRLAQRTMRVGEVLELAPGAILELHRSAESELELLVNNCSVGFGVAVKVGENFGIRVTHMGDPAKRVQPTPAPTEDADSADALAEALLAGQ
jgi:flagellar motor switch protein FliN/FliY